ncbi:hypothetical protein EV359DRAFT_88107 [Lentinula novae-zelandiae]|nr:hypothetical protein EV359DRAFT_88107 [Lentinula novae-zelandiae]
MSTSRTSTSTIPPRSQARAGPSNLPMAPPPDRRADIDEDDDEDEIMRKALAKVQRVKERKAEEAARRRAEEEEERRKVAREQAAREARERAVRARQQEEEVTERRRLMAEAATVRSQRETSPSERSVSPRRPVVEIRRAVKGKGMAKVQPVGGDPDDGDDDDDDEEDRAPCERCKTKKLSCQMQAGKRSSIICKPCHDAKVKCSYSGRPTISKQREGGSGERIAVMESQMAQSLADLRSLREADSKTHQYLRQLLRRQEDDHARLIAMETRMAMMGMGEGPVAAGPSRRNTERQQPLKRRRIVEESEEEKEGAEEEKGVEEKENEVEKDGEGEEEEMVEEEPAPAKVQSEKGKERAVE